MTRLFLTFPSFLSKRRISPSKCNPLFCYIITYLFSLLVFFLFFFLTCLFLLFLFLYTWVSCHRFVLVFLQHCLSNFTDPKWKPCFLFIWHQYFQLRMWVYRVIYKELISALYKGYAMFSLLLAGVICHYYQCK